MERCRVCGKIETPLRDGVCPQCIAVQNMPESLAQGAEKAIIEPDRACRYASASVFLWTGSVLEIVGIPLLLSAQRLRYSPALPVLALIGAALVVFGSILVSVGIIRWGIWPLIERAERD